MAQRDQVETVFAEAIEIGSLQERAAFLDRACQDEPSLRQEVEKLVVDYFRAGQFLEHPIAQIPAPSSNQPDLERPGSQIGPYKLLQVIGEGGMGTVFMAKQAEPVQRRVALKVIKPGMDSRLVIARFDAEKQALAMMDHVNIARVLDAGTTPQGRPYFVMELVHGVPITTYCDDNHLTPRERLQLFLPVCQAIQHAHQKGIIHRDIKPSNVMVTLNDGTPFPKVIDFGVAKATEQRLTEQTQFTHYGMTVGTLEYMSPEQAEMSAMGVDTRSDIYSLGILLYELLTGSTPLSRNHMKGAAYAEILRLIKEEVPPKPSTRLTDSGEALASIGAQRSMEPAKLTKLVRGELDWIVMKTLDKDRSRRYATANGLAADLQRYLNDEPVVAGPPSAKYRFHKFVHRNKSLVLAASLVVLALVGGVIGTAIGLIRANEARLGEVRQRQLATVETQKALAAAEAEKKSNEIAQTREAESRAVLDFVETKVLAAARPKGQAGGLGRDVTLRQAVEAALPFVGSGFQDQPLIEARLRMALGTSFSYLGDANIAVEQFEAARALYTQHRGPDHPDTLISMQNLASSYHELGRSAEALQLRQETLALRKATLGPNHRDTLASMHDLAISSPQAEALQLREKTLALRKATLGPDHPDTLASMHHLASSYTHLGRRAESLQLNQETLALRKAVLGPDHPDTLLSMNNLAKSYDELGRHAEAAALFEETLAIEKATLGPEHLNTLRCMANLAGTYNELGRHAEALQLRVDTLATVKATLGPDHPFTLACMHNLGVSYQKLDRHAEAAALLEETLALKIARNGPAHPGTLLCMDVLAGSYAALGRHVTSARMCEHTLSLVPELFAAVNGAYGYNAACAATLAGCESGGVEPELDELERSRWREQARSWLSEDLKYWTKLSRSSRLDELRQAAATLEYWQTDPDLTGLRDAARIAQFPEQERASCEQLWTQVNSLLALVREAASSHPSSTSTNPIQD